MLDRIDQIRQGVDFIPLHSGGDAFADGQELLELARDEPSSHKRHELIAQAQQHLRAAEVAATETGNHEVALRIETMLPFAPMMVEFDHIGEHPLSDNKRRRIERQLDPAAIRRQVVLTAATTLATYESMLRLSDKHKAPLRHEPKRLRELGLAEGDQEFDALIEHMRSIGAQYQIPDLNGLLHEQTLLIGGFLGKSTKTLYAPAFFYDDVHGDRRLRRDVIAHDYRSQSNTMPILQHVGVQVKASVQDEDRARYHGSICLISGNGDLANERNAPIWRTVGRKEQFSTLRALIDQELGLPGRYGDAEVLAAIFAKNQRKIEIVRKSGLDTSRGQPRAVGRNALNLSA